MSQIIAARFTTFPDAESAKERLLASGFVDEDIAEFFVNPAGQHARFPIGGDRYADPQARPAGLGATGGGAIGALVGAAIAAVLTFAIFHSLLVLIVATAVGAYIGSLAGALLLTRGGRKGAQPAQAPEEPHERESGVLLAVHINPEQETVVRRVLAEANGTDIELASGTWRDGHWADFDPTKKVKPADTSGPANPLAQ